MLRDPETKRLVRKAFKYRPSRRSAFNQAPDDEPPTSISRSLVDHVLGQKKAVLSQDAGNDKNLPTSASIADLKIRSVMCAPLLTPDGEASGIIQLDTSDRKQFQQEDLDVLAAVASQAAIAIQNAAMHETLLARERIERDLKIAEQVQKRFLPQSVPKVDGFEFFAHYNPAYEVGGDYYDFVPLPQQPAGDRAGGRLGQGGRGGADDGQVLGGHAVLHPHRELPRGGRQRAEQPALRRRDRGEVHHAQPERPRPVEAPPDALLGRPPPADRPARRRDGRGGGRRHRGVPAGHPARLVLPADRGRTRAGRRGRRLLRRRDRLAEPEGGALRLARPPTAPEAGRRLAGRARRPWGGRSCRTSASSPPTTPRPTTSPCSASARPPGRPELPSFRPPSLDIATAGLGPSNPLPWP